MSRARVNQDLRKQTCHARHEFRQRVLFGTGCLFNESSGPYLSLMQTARALEGRGHDVTVLGTGGRGQGQPSGWGAEALAFRRYGPFSLHCAPALSHWLRHEDWRWDVVSLQSVWSHVNAVIADQCRCTGTPYMVTTHGNLNPVALSISSWKKRLAAQTFMRPVFRHATCYQASTKMEYEALRAYGIVQPICIIGNGIELPDFKAMPEPETLLPGSLTVRRTCLYLGRLHPIKGIDRLLRAWGRMRPSDDWQLVVAGGGDEAYCAELEDIARQAQCRNVYFTDFVSSQVKSALLRQAEMFVLPSHSEAFAMAPMEAFSYATPALLTTGCRFPEAAEAGGAIEVTSSESGICAGLEHILSLSPAQLASMGERAFSFVRKRYDWQVVCTELESVYAWMRGAGPVPHCMRLD